MPSADRISLAPDFDVVASARLSEEFLITVGWICSPICLSRRSLVRWTMKSRSEVDVVPNTCDSPGGAGLFQLHST
jgi:hypothetical protein